MTHKIILETDDIVLHYHKGSSDFLLITFMGAFEERHALNSYFCKPVCEENNISCIGVTTKQRNWYHSANMHRALKIIRSYCKNFSKVISFGPSAGAYAAVKYSKILKTDATIALAPLIILDKEEELQAMAIKPSHLFGEIFLFVDPNEPRDIATAQAIENSAQKQTKATVHLIHVPNAGHVILNSIKGRKNLFSLISTAESSKLSVIEKEKEFKKNARIFSRYSLDKLYNKIRMGHLRHPYLVYQMLRGKSIEKVKNYEEIFHEAGTYYILIHRLQAMGYTKEARSFLKTMMTYQLSKKLDFSDSHLAESAKCKKIMLDHRGGVVSYVAETRHFLSDNPLWIKRNTHTVFIKKIRNKEYPFISCLRSEFFISKTETGNTTLTEKPGNLSIEYLDNQCCVKADDNTYLTVSNGNEHYWSDTPRDWERFSPISLFSA